MLNVAPYNLPPMVRTAYNHIASAVEDLNVWRASTDFVPDQAKVAFIQAHLKLEMERLAEVTTFPAKDRGPKFQVGDRVVVDKLGSEHYGCEADILRGPVPRNPTYLVALENGDLRSYYEYDLARLLDS